MKRYSLNITLLRVFPRVTPLMLSLMLVACGACNGEVEPAPDVKDAGGPTDAGIDAMPPQDAAAQDAGPDPKCLEDDALRDACRLALDAGKTVDLGTSAACTGLPWFAPGGVYMARAGGREGCAVTPIPGGSGPQTALCCLLSPGQTTSP
jgi:hypothetical protein